MSEGNDVPTRHELIIRKNLLELSQIDSGSSPVDSSLIPEGWVYVVETIAFAPYGSGAGAIGVGLTDGVATPISLFYVAPPSVQDTEFMSPVHFTVPPGKLLQAFAGEGTWDVVVGGYYLPQYAYSGLPG